MSSPAAPRQTASDKDLVIAFQRGEPDAFATIYERYRSPVTNVCRRLLRDPHDAEEATQETFAKAFAALARFNGRYLLEPWLRRIAANVCLDELRSRANAPHQVPLSAALEPGEPEPGPESLLINSGKHVGETVQQLLPLHAAALRLRAEENLSYEEMANRLSMTPSQVRSLLHRARSSFRRAWKRVEGWALLPLSLGERWRWMHSYSGGSADGSAAVEQAVAAAIIAVTVFAAPSSQAVAPHRMREASRQQHAVQDKAPPQPEVVFGLAAGTNVKSASSPGGSASAEVATRHSGNDSTKSEVSIKDKSGKAKKLPPGLAAGGKKPPDPPGQDKAPGSAVAKAARLLKEAQHGVGVPSVAKVAKGLHKKHKKH